MKINAILFAFVLATASVSSSSSAKEATTGTEATSTSTAGSTASSSATATTASSGTSSSATAKAGSGTSTSGNDPFTNLQTHKYPKDSYHMPPVRAVHARVQSDAPILIDGVFVSSYGHGKLEAGYVSAMDTVNTASVEGALMYVQAEGININNRAEDERCIRKNGMANVVFYEVIIVQTNETLAQFQDSWGETPEYGPMLPMDSGSCTPLSGKDVFPAGCLQFNGDKGQPNVGPFVGAGIKDDDVRAPYPNNYWFSFPNTCPLKGWKDKTDQCRNTTRKGLCSYGEGPDGVDCTFSYNILGWVAIDDVVGITSIENPDTGSTYANFSEWCMADSNNTEFAADAETGEMTTGLPFWEDPLNSTVNALRAEALVATYEQILSSGSPQIETSTIKAFRSLPTPKELAALNPPCYESVESCGSGNGCKRVGYSQLCTACKADEGCKTSGNGFVYPKLVKAYTKLSKEETTTAIAVHSNSTDSGSSAGSQSGSSAAAPTTFTIASVAVGIMTAMLAL